MLSLIKILDVVSLHPFRASRRLLDVARCHVVRPHAACPADLCTLQFTGTSDTFETFFTHRHSSVSLHANKRVNLFCPVILLHSLAYLSNWIPIDPVYPSDNRLMVKQMIREIRGLFLCSCEWYHTPEFTKGQLSMSKWGIWWIRALLQGEILPFTACVWPVMTPHTLTCL